MNEKKICQINGDGIGQEVVPVAVEMLSILCPEVAVSIGDAGWGTFERCGDSVPSETLNSIKSCTAAIFGAVSSPSKKVAGYQSAILKMRQSLGLNANIRPVDSRFGNRTESHFRFVVVRENSEGLYARIEESDGQTAFAKKVVTVRASREIGTVAAQTAQIYGLDRITIVHKANILPETDGMFRDSVREGIEQTTGSEKLIVDELLVDTAALKVVDQPERFGVIVTSNLYGDILSDVAAYWCGGLELAPSLNLGNGCAVCEPVHGSAPDIAGQGLADPRAAVLSLALLCRLHWNEPKLADHLAQSVLQSLGNPSLKSTEEIKNQLLGSL